MHLSRPHRILAVLTLSLLASLSPALAQPRSRPARVAVPDKILETIRGSVLQLRDGLLGLLQKAGADIDPDGGFNDAGSKIDPDGASAAENEAGSGLNPDGRS
jgi:hypothetical protein